MLLSGYRKEISQSATDTPSHEMHCIAYLNEDICEVLPYLNAVLDGNVFIRVPPSFTFKLQRGCITVYARKIVLDAFNDEAVVDSFLIWIKQVINETWEKRETLIPKYYGNAKPHVIEIYELLPKTDCCKCGLETCMRFASLAARGAKDFMDCPELTLEEAIKLKDYLCRFYFD